MAKGFLEQGRLGSINQSKIRLQRLGVWLALIIGLSTTACTETRYVVGAPPHLEVLDQRLELGTASTEDVLAVLGKPNGAGVIFLPIDRKRREMWSYYYEKGLVKATDSGRLDAETRRTFLFVYFDHEHYDGYMWFSSLPQ